ncbi:MAG TPA: glucokinase [Candidatus Acidoferrales bacterium]|nr:glucokinase [Candidatus Acidoferrales bacterium]
MILAGDIGGTKTNLGLFEIQNGVLTKIIDKRYASHEHTGLAEIVADFVGTTQAKVTAAGFGVAGAVADYHVHTSNLPWNVDGATMARELKLGRVRLLNDVEATAYGIGILGPSSFETLHEGISALPGTRVVIAAGTGLGEAILFWDGIEHIVTATEGGHADFAPHTVRQAELWKFIKARSEFVSTELVLSGRGFRTVHEFLSQAVRHPAFDDPQADSAAEITRMALTKECPVCVDTVGLWVEIYGSEAGNLAVRSLARGGIYVAGGIAVKILPLLKDGRFVSAVQHKEKMTAALTEVPIRVVLDEECPLKGAASAAWRARAEQC